MEVTFKNKKLKKQFTDAKERQKAFGKLAKQIKLRMQQFDAAKTLQDIMLVPQAECHVLKGDRKEQFSVKISRNFRIVFIINQSPVPLQDNGEINLDAVTSIKIIEVVDYHQ